MKILQDQCQILVFNLCIILRQWIMDFNQIHIHFYGMELIWFQMHSDPLHCSQVSNMITHVSNSLGIFAGSNPFPSDIVTEGYRRLNVP